MKTRSLSFFLRRTPVTFRVDLFKPLPNKKAIVGQYDNKKEIISVGIIVILNPKLLSTLRTVWRGKHPTVMISRRENIRFPVIQ